MATLIDLLAWRDAALAAYNALVSGQAVVEVHADGYVTRYQRADAAKLKAWISELEVRIAGAQRGCRVNRGAIGVVF